jgi:hypothetical protein
LYIIYRNSYSVVIAIPFRRGIGIPLKKVRNTYSFPAGINICLFCPKTRSLSTPNG